MCLLLEIYIKIVIALVLCQPIITGGYSCYLFEDTAEILHIGIAQFLRHCTGCIALFQ